MIKHLLICVLLGLGLFPKVKAIDVYINGIKSSQVNTHYLISRDHIRLKAQGQIDWVRFLPYLKEYDNISQKLAPIHYHIESYGVDKQEISFTTLSPGTYLFGQAPDTGLSILATQALHLTESNIIQLVIRQDDTYLGYLTEMLQTPFILPPKRIRHGYQTDLHIGTDCAELAIYGRRRMGYAVPYVGPRGIGEYLEEADSVFAGAVLHFGFQVSVLYEDRGIIGVIDEADLLIHAYHHLVHIVTFGETDLWKKTFRLMQWK